MPSLRVSRCLARAEGECLTPGAPCHAPLTVSHHCLQMSELVRTSMAWPSDCAAIAARVKLSTPAARARPTLVEFILAWPEHGWMRASAPEAC